VTDFHDDLDVEDDFEDQAHHAGTDVETLLHRVADLIGNARPMPLSASVMINRDEVLELVEEALSRLPEELRAARWLLREREEFLAKVQREGDDILDAARVRAERMVQRTEVVRNAQHTARQVIDDAEGEARRLRHEAEDFCDQKLAQFEIVLDRTIRTVQAGRSRLQAAVPEEEEDRSTSTGEPEFFDQDDL
jgi:cell division septum initiation protein DivIVA